MSWYGGVDVRFYKAGSFSRTIDILRDAGWGFYQDQVSYGCDPDEGEAIGVELHATVAELPILLPKLDQAVERGSAIVLHLAWQSEEPIVTFVWRGERGMSIYAGPGVPRLPGSRHLTSWDWLLTRTLVPLMAAAYDPREVECRDSH